MLRKLLSAKLIQNGPQNLVKRSPKAFRKLPLQCWKLITNMSTFKANSCFISSTYNNFEGAWAAFNKPYVKGNGNDAIKNTWDALNLGQYEINVVKCILSGLLSYLWLANAMWPRLERRQREIKCRDCIFPGLLSYLAQQLFKQTFLMTLCIYLNMLVK